MALVAGLGAFGVVGTPTAPERFDAKFVVVAPADPSQPTDDGLRITEFIDQDFGTERRRGHERFIPVDFGVPTEITAASETAPDDVDVRRFGSEVRIRIGDPDVTITGQHRYVLGFTLSEAQLSTGELALDIIGTDETFETGRFEVVVTGLELESPTCNVGRRGAVGGCTFTRQGDRYHAVIEPLPPGAGITIGGRIVGRGPVDPPPTPPLPEPRRTPDRRALVTVGSLLLGLLTAAGVHRLMARAGRDEVFGGGGAVDAAFGPDAGPGALDPAGVDHRTMPTSLLSDRELNDLATIEFVPPPGLQPWEGAVLLTERIDNETVSAWFAGLVGQEIIDLDKRDSRTIVVSRGSAYRTADARTKMLIDSMFRGRERLELGAYDSSFAEFWEELHKHQVARTGASGWWRRLGPGERSRFWRFFEENVVYTLVVAFSLVVLVMSVPTESLLWAAGVAIVVPAVVALAVYAALLPARSAPGSALALRTESFRRFLAASEGQHVEWAWERGLIREYSGWAVALGAADAWSAAVERSAVVPSDVSLVSPLLFASMAGSVTSTRVNPSSSGTGSGGRSGGFSGGRVGGGGGGGRSGSW